MKKLKTSTSFKWIFGVLLFVLIFFLVTQKFKFGEVAKRNPVKINWNVPGNIQAVSYSRFASIDEAKNALADSEALSIVMNGEEVFVTQLESGFRSSRLLHRYLGFKIVTNDGVEDVFVPVSVGLIENGFLNLDNELEGKAAH